MLPEQELSLRCLKIYVRAKGIIECLLDGTSKVQTPVALFSFIKRLALDGKNFPSDYLLPIEKKRLSYDTDGRTT